MRDCRVDAAAQNTGALGSIQMIGFGFNLILEKHLTFTSTATSTILSPDTTIETAAPGHNSVTFQNGTLNWERGTFWGTTLMIAGGATKADLYIKGNVTLSAGSILANQGRTFWESGTISANANISINNSGTFTITGANTTAEPTTGQIFLANSGTFTRTTGGTTTLKNTAFTNTGSLLINAAATLRVEGGINELRQTAGLTELSDSATLDVPSGYRMTAGEFKARASTVSGTLNVAGGTVYPGFAGLAETLTVTSYNQTAGTLHIDINNATNAYDRISYSGNVTVGGTSTLQVVTTNGPPTRTYDIIARQAGTGTITGDFTVKQLNGEYTTSIVNNNTTYRLTPVQQAQLGMFSGWTWLDTVIPIGIQNTGETGIAGLLVELYQSGELVNSVTTDANGNYQFFNVAPGTYSLMFHKPAGYNFSPKDQGGNDAVDSDVYATGLTDLFRLAAGGFIDLDAGLVPI